MAQRVEDSPAGETDRRNQIREAIRLLYVSVTRARDFLILPLQAKAKTRPWLDTLGAEWLRSTDGALVLPSGEAIPCVTDVFAAPAEVEQVTPETEQPWFTESLPQTSKLPAVVSPSACPEIGDASVGRVIELGERIRIQDKVDVDVLGDALHAILAVELVTPEYVGRLKRAEAILARHGLSGALDAGEVVGAVERFRHAINEWFSPVRVLPEWPVTIIQDTGQRMNGWIDALIDTPEGWVIVDHKSFPGGRVDWPGKALNYSGQLNAYRRAVEQATGKPVVSQWIHFSVGGGMVEVRLSNA